MSTEAALERHIHPFKPAALMAQAYMASVHSVMMRASLQVIAPALAMVASLCVQRTPCPNDKIVHHLVTMATLHISAESIAKQESAGLSLSSIYHNLQGSGNLGKADEMFRKASEGLGAEVFMDITAPAADASQVDPARSAAECALRQLVRRTGSQLSTMLPQLWRRMTEPLESMAWGAKHMHIIAVAARLLHITALDLDAAVHVALRKRLSTTVGWMCNTSHGVRAALAAALAALAAAQPSCHLEPLVAELVSRAGVDKCDGSRCAAVSLLTAALNGPHALTLDLLPYAPLLAAPALALMSDPIAAVRTQAAAAFGRIVAILPLATGAPVPPTPSLPDDMRSRRLADGAFLEQLTNAAGTVAYALPVEPAGVVLRGYQRDGVAWLAFLRRFGLHGVLADDMGLGKTLQTLCIVAAVMHEATDSASDGATARPSLVVCPASLVGHWVAEANRYFGHSPMRALAFQACFWFMLLALPGFTSCTNMACKNAESMAGKTLEGCGRHCVSIVSLVCRGRRRSARRCRSRSTRRAAGCSWSRRTTPCAPARPPLRSCASCTASSTRAT
jgi:TATA-binding protein-associated factor